MMACWRTRLRKLPLLAAAVAGGFMVALSGIADEARAAEMVGLVTDYQPRTPKGGTPAVTIKRNGQVVQVREHEIVYAGDVFVFASPAPPKASVEVLVGADTSVTLDPDRPSLPSRSTWVALQSITPRLVSAYRWINPSSGGDKAAPSHAISRGDGDNAPLAVLPEMRGKLTISTAGAAPLWIGWAGGKPPFVVSVSAGERLVKEARVCEAPVAATGCVREALLNGIGDGDASLTLSVTDAAGASWKAILVRSAIARAGDGGDAKDLGKLRVFLDAVALLDRGRGDYVLESARELSAIAGSYKPARELLDLIRMGQVP